MATTITSRIKLASGYEIPRLGFGVCDHSFYNNIDAKLTETAGLQDVMTPL